MEVVIPRTFAPFCLDHLEEQRVKSSRIPEGLSADADLVDLIMLLRFPGGRPQSLSMLARRRACGKIGMG